QRCRPGRDEALVARSHTSPEQPTKLLWIDRRTPARSIEPRLYTTPRNKEKTDRHSSKRKSPRQNRPNWRGALQRSARFPSVRAPDVWWLSHSGSLATKS